MTHSGHNLWDFLLGRTEQDDRYLKKDDKSPSLRLITWTGGDLISLATTPIEVQQLHKYMAIVQFKQLACYSLSFAHLVNGRVANLRCMRICDANYVDDT